LVDSHILENRVTRATYHDLKYNVVPHLLEDIPRNQKCLSSSLHVPFCSLSITPKNAYILFNNLKFTLKHLKRSYIFRSYDHPQAAYIVDSHILENRMTRATYHDLKYNVVPQLLEDIPVQTTVLCAIVSITRSNSAVRILF